MDALVFSKRRVMNEFPRRIVLEKWADSGFYWQGAVPVAFFERLSAMTVAKQQDDPTLALSCRLSKTEGVLWLDFRVEGVLWLNCHRCLQPLAQDITGKYRLALVQSARDLPYVGENDYVRLDELPDTRTLELAFLIEDELLLNIPIAATHADCTFVQAGSIAIEEEKPNPFAVLAALKNKDGD